MKNWGGLGTVSACVPIRERIKIYIYIYIFDASESRGCFGTKQSAVVFFSANGSCFCSVFCLFFSGDAIDSLNGVNPPRAAPQACDWINWVMF